MAMIILSIFIFLIMYYVILILVNGGIRFGKGLKTSVLFEKTNFQKKN
jgi:hypothetical protein